MLNFSLLNIENIETPEILILGSSLANTNINPFIMAEKENVAVEKILNFGFSYATPFNMLLNVIKYKKYLENVKKLFISLEPFILTEKFYINKPYEKFLLNQKQLRYIKIHSQNYIQKYHPDFWVFDIKLLEQIHNPSYLSFNKDFNGFEPRLYNDFTVDVKKYIKLLFKPIDLFEIASFQIKSLKKIVSIFKHSEIYFVLSPAFGFYKLYEKHLYKFDLKLVKELKKELGNCEIIGTLKGECFKKQDFADYMHLNIAGANKFTSNILQQKATNLYDIKSLLELKLPCKVDKCHLWKMADELIKAIEIFIKGKNRVALLGYTEIAKLIMFYFKNIKFIIFDDIYYDDKKIFNTQKINTFNNIDVIIQTHFGDKIFVKLPYFKISSKYKILRMYLKMHLTLYNTLDKKNCF